MANCTNTGFDVVGSAGSYSALAGVVAGVLFTGVVLLVSVGHPSPDSPPSDPNRSAALEAMVPAFFTMLAAGFLFAVMGGEDVCRRADIEATAAGTLFAVGAIGAFQAVAWMLQSFESGNNRLAGCVAATRFSVAALGVVQLAVNAASIQADYRPSTTASVFIYVFLGLGALLIATCVTAWWWQQWSVQLPAWWVTPAQLGTLVIAVTVFDLAVNSWPAYWQAGGPPALAVVGNGMLMVAYLPAMAVHLLAAPRRHPKPSGLVPKFDGQSAAS